MRSTVYIDMTQILRYTDQCTNTDRYFFSYIRTTYYTIEVFLACSSLLDLTDWIEWIIVKGVGSTVSVNEVEVHPVSVLSSVRFVCVPHEWPDLLPAVVPHPGPLVLQLYPSGPPALSTNLASHQSQV